MTKAGLIWGISTLMVCWEKSGFAYFNSEVLFDYLGSSYFGDVICGDVSTTHPIPDGQFADTKTRHKVEAQRGSALKREAGTYLRQSPCISRYFFVTLHKGFINYLQSKAKFSIIANFC